MSVYEYTTTELIAGKRKQVKKYRYDFRKRVNGVTYRGKKEGFDSKEECLSAELEDKLNIGKPKEEKKTILLNDLFDMYLSDNSLKKKASTIQNYRYRYNHIISFFNNIPITMLDHAKISKFKKNLVSNNISDDYINKSIYMLRDMLIYAKRRKYMFDDSILIDLDGIKTSKLPVERIAWSIDEVYRFFSSFNLEDEKESLFYHYFKILLDSTCRPNEFRCLQVKDIQGQYLNINKSCTTKLKGKGLVLQTPKTKGSIRKVIMPQEDIDYLVDHTKGYKPTDFIFGKDTVLSETTLSRELTKHIGLADVRHIGLYNLRHTSITHMLKDGAVPLIIVSKRAGHSNVSTTMNHYWHLFNGEEDKALDGLKLLKIDENTTKFTTK